MPQLVNKNPQKNQLRLSFSGSLLFLKKMKLPFKIKKQSLNRNSEKDSCWGINNFINVIYFCCRD